MLALADIWSWAATLAVFGCAFLATGCALTNVIFVWRHVVLRDPSGSYVFCLGSIAAFVAFALTPAAVDEPPLWVMSAWGVCVLLDGCALSLLELIAEGMIAAGRAVVRRLR